MRHLPPSFAARALIGASLACAALPAVAADASIHSGHLQTILGTGERVVCIVTNVDEKPIDEVRVRIRAYEFGTTPADLTCQDVQPGSACKLEFPASGSPIIMHFACSADFTAKADAMRGTFYRTSSTGTTSDLALEMR
jgi:hypothetical protein